MYLQKPLYIKTILIHDYSQLQGLKQNILESEDSITILIARIAPILLKDSDGAAKLVNELYDSAEIRSKYSLFRLGKDRFLLIPNYAKTQQI